MCIRDSPPAGEGQAFAAPVPRSAPPEGIDVAERYPLRRRCAGPGEWPARHRTQRAALAARAAGRRQHRLHSRNARDIRVGHQGRSARAAAIAIRIAALQLVSLLAPPPSERPSKPLATREDHGGLPRLSSGEPRLVAIMGNKVELPLAPCGGYCPPCFGIRDRAPSGDVAP